MGLLQFHADKARLPRTARPMSPSSPARSLVNQPNRATPLSGLVHNDVFKALLRRLGRPACPRLGAKGQGLDEVLVARHVQLTCSASR